MAYSVKVTLGHLICRNMESSTAPHDIFALAGAVTVDGTRNGFAMSSVPVNEQQTWSYFETIFDGISQTPTIQLELLGLDIDDNEKWVENREDAHKLAETISDVAEKVPVIGDIASLVITAIPKVVDAFVEWDNDDVLLNWSSSINMSAEAGVPFKMGSREIEVKFSGSDPVGYSDWDYSLFLAVECTLIAPLFGDDKVEKKLTPFVSSGPSNWLGHWESAVVRCAIRASDGVVPNLVDVDVREITGGVETNTENLGIGISRVFLELAYTELASDAVLVAGADKDDELLEYVGITPRYVVEHVAGRTSTVTELAGLFLLDHPLPIVVSGTREVPYDVLPPARRQSGCDLLELSNDAVLEIYHVLHDGEDVGDVQLRYIRPATNITVLLGGEIDEMLHAKVI